MRNRAGSAWTSAIARLRAERAPLIALGLLVLAGLAVRIWLTAAWRPAFLGYPDTGTYLLIAANGPFFADSLRTVGYVVFLRAVHGVSAHLTTVVVTQHLLGVASALLLYGAVRRLTRSPWPGLLAAAVVLLCGTEVFLEHAILTESMFIFLLAGAVYATVRALDSDRIWWPLLAGLLVGTATTVRVVGLFMVPVVASALVFIRRSSWLTRGRLAGAALAGSLAILFAYAAAQDDQAGYFGLTRAGLWNFYGRVAPFADCRQFTPPKGTAQLCETTPPSKRPGPETYVFGGSSPAVRAFGGPFNDPQASNDKVAAFARAAAINQPLDYLHAIVRDMWRYVAPDSFNFPGAGLSATGFVDQNLLIPVPRTLTPYWQTSGYRIDRGAERSLDRYERDTRLQGPLMVILVLLALAAPFLARGRRERVGAAFLTVAAAGSLVVPVASFYYDARIAVPAFGLLAAAAGVGAFGLVRLLAPLVARWLPSARKRELV